MNILTGVKCKRPCFQIQEKTSILVCLVCKHSEDIFVKIETVSDLGPQILAKIVKKSIHFEFVLFISNIFFQFFTTRLS